VVTGIRIDHDEPERTSFLPYLVVAAAVAVGLWMLHGEVTPPTDLNDAGLHHSMVRWAADRISSGENPFDGWWPFLGLGFPQLHQYPSLPHVLSGAVGEVIGVARTYHWSLYLLLAGWPIAVYWSSRLVGLDQWTAAAAAAVSPLVVSVTGYGFEAVSYVWQGYGMWPQLWAMWLLPFAIATTWRALDGRGAPWVAGLLIALTVACHFPTGYLALAITGVLVVVHVVLDVRSVWRGVLLLASAGTLLAVVLVPVLLDRSAADYSGYDAGTFYDSYGARQVIGWLVTGHLLDHGRLPVLTVLAGVGLVVCALRATRETPYLVVLITFALSLVLFFGRPTLGRVADLLPFGADLFFPRFIAGVHLGAIVLAAIGLVWVGSQLAYFLEPLGPRELVFSVIGVAAAIVLAPAVTERVTYHAEGRDFMATQRAADAGDGVAVRRLLDLVRDEPGRVYAGRSDGWGAEYKVGYVPMHALLLEEDVDAVGYLDRVASLGTAVESLFDEGDVESYAVFGVRWLLLPSDRSPTVPATLVATEGDHRLYAVDGAPGYVRVVAGLEAVDADKESLERVAAEAILDGRLDATSAPLLAWEGASGVPSALGLDQGTVGSVPVAVIDARDGTIDAEVHADQAAWLATSWSWHPRWTATVDGEAVEPAMLAPAVLGVPVPAGDHVVTIRYQPFRGTPVVAAIGVGAFAALALLPWLFARRRLRSEAGGSRTDA
jgi:hypothetical protein